MQQFPIQQHIERHSQNIFAEVSTWLEDFLGVSPDIQWKLLSSFFVIFLLLLLRRVFYTIINRYNTDIRQSYRYRNSVSYIVIILMLLLVGRIWFEGVDSILTYFGLVSAGIAIALQVPIVNMAGFVYLITRKPFEVGDRIKIGGFAGDVIDISIFQFSLNEIGGEWVDAQQSSGRIIHIPNGKVFNEPQINYTEGFLYIWNEIQVMVTFESDWEKTKEILQKIIDEKAEKITEKAKQEIKRASKKYALVYNKFSPIVYTNVKDSGINFSIRYLCNPRGRRGSQEQIWEAILKEFAQHNDIDLAYPTIRYFNNISEGKSGGV